MTRAISRLLNDRRTLVRELGDRAAELLPGGPVVRRFDLVGGEAALASHALELELPDVAGGHDGDGGDRPVWRLMLGVDDHGVPVAAALAEAWRVVVHTGESACAGKLGLMTESGPESGHRHWLPPRRETRELPVGELVAQIEHNLGRGGFKSVAQARLLARRAADDRPLIELLRTAGSNVGDWLGEPATWQGAHVSYVTQQARGARTVGVGLRTLPQAARRTGIKRELGGALTALTARRVTVELVPA